VTSVTGTGVSVADRDTITECKRNDGVSK